MAGDEVDFRGSFTKACPVMAIGDIKKFYIVFSRVSEYKLQPITSSIWETIIGHQSDVEKLLSETRAKLS